MIQDPDAIIKVRENLDSWLAAFNAKDIEALFSLYDPSQVQITRRQS